MKRDTQAHKRDTRQQRADIAAVSGENQKSGEPNRIRTCDPLIKSQLLYQLSYGPNGGLPMGGSGWRQAEK